MELPRIACGKTATACDRDSRQLRLTRQYVNHRSRVIIPSGDALADGRNLRRSRQLRLFIQGHECPLRATVVAEVVTRHPGGRRAAQYRPLFVEWRFWNGDARSLASDATRGMGIAMGTELPKGKKPSIISYALLAGASFVTLIAPSYAADLPLVKAPAPAPVSSWARGDFHRQLELDRPCGISALRFRHGGTDQ